MRKEWRMESDGVTNLVAECFKSYVAVSLSDEARTMETCLSSPQARELGTVLTAWADAMGAPHKLSGREERLRIVSLLEAKALKLEEDARLCEKNEKGKPYFVDDIRPSDEASAMAELIRELVEEIGG